MENFPYILTVGQKGGSRYMARDDTMIVGTAGEHFVAFRLAQLGCIVGLPRVGSPSVDLLVSDRTGTKTVAIQVKTAEWAMRERGRGSNRKPHHLEFPLGHRAADISDPRVLYAFVDLKGRDPSSVPDVYIVPSADIHKYCSGWAKGAKLVRWHPDILTAEPYCNDWSRIQKVLA